MVLCHITLYCQFNFTVLPTARMQKKVFKRHKRFEHEPVRERVVNQKRKNAETLDNSTLQQNYSKHENVMKNGSVFSS